MPTVLEPVFWIVRGIPFHAKAVYSGLICYTASKFRGFINEIMEPFRDKGSASLVMRICMSSLFTMMDLVFKQVFVDQQLGSSGLHEVQGAWVDLQRMYNMTMSLPTRGQTFWNMFFRPWATLDTPGYDTYPRPWAWAAQARPQMQPEQTYAAMTLVQLVLLACLWVPVLFQLMAHLYHRLSAYCQTPPTTTPGAVLETTQAATPSPQNPLLTEMKKYLTWPRASLALTLIWHYAQNAVPQEARPASYCR
jgi:hypothetical protein